MHAGTAPNPSFSDVVGKKTFVPASIGQSFGPTWTTHWFRVEASVPPEWSDGDAPLLLCWDSGSEAMIYSEDGQPQQGVTDQRNEFQLSATIEPGRAFVVYVEMACNGMFGTTEGIKPPVEDRFFTLKEAGLAWPRPAVRKLYYDLLVLSDLAKTLPPDSAAGAEALFIANKVVNTFRPAEPSTWEAARDVAASFLGRSGGALPAAASARHKVVAIGHCHIDTAWLWPFSETRRKTARSWSSQVRGRV